MPETDPSVEASIPFDRAVEYYDRTRSLSPEATRRVIDLLSPELRGRHPCLEIGVGTGRIALPLWRAGVSIVGVDLSLPMLERLVANAGGRRPFPLALADALKLPFEDGAFGSALAAHVLHLVADWRAALGELLRVVRGGGVLLFDLGRWEGGWWQEVQQRFRDEAGIAPRRSRAEFTAAVDEAMLGLGAKVRELPVIEETLAVTPTDWIDRLERGEFSFTWSADADTRRGAAERVRTWAREHLGALDEPRESVRRIGWRVFDLPP
jgi:ubiquinone/menaquinone biosynthesis C-methylase UbiE